MVNWFCWIGCTLILLSPTVRVLREKGSFVSMDLFMGAGVWITYFPFLGLYLLGYFRNVPLSQETVQTALAFALACNIAWFVGRKIGDLMFPKPVRVTLSVIETESFSGKIQKLAAVGGIGYIMMIVALPHQFEAYQMSRFEVIRSKVPILWQAGVYLSQGLLIAFAAVVLDRKRIWTYSWILGAVVILNCILFVQVRSRTNVLATMIAFAIGAIEVSRQPKRGVLILAGAAVLLILSASVMNIARGSINLDLATFSNRMLHSDYEVAFEETFTNGDLAYAEVYCQALEVVPNQHEYLYGASYFSWPLALIPRSLLPWKPQDTQIVFCSIVNPEMASNGGTIPPSIYGDAYINFGYFGAGIFVLWGVFLKWLDSFCTARGRPLYWRWALIGCMAVAGPHFARGGFNNAMVIIVFNFFLVHLLCRYNRFDLARIHAQQAQMTSSTPPTPSAPSQPRPPTPPKSTSELYVQ